ncbi:hypothetical protein [Nostoc linckia]|nr:hypothetical protein [Nostoc linckia]
MTPDRAERWRAILRQATTRYRRKRELMLFLRESSQLIEKMDKENGN